MKQVLFNLLLTFFISWGIANAATNTLHDKPLKAAPSSTDETYVWDTGTSTLKKTTFSPFLVGDCTGFPCLDGTSDGGNYIKFWAGTGSYWTALQGGSPAANRSWRLPIAAPPSAGTTYLMNMDEYGQMGFVAPSSFLTPTGSGAALTIDASGFDGNLATSDNTLQEVSQKVDDLIVGGGGYTNLTSFVGQTAWRLFYSDGSGDVKELSLGSDGEYLKSNGAALAPSWATPSGAAHDAVTLGTDADAVLGLSAQQITLDSQTTNTIFASPNGSAGDPTFRALVEADMPTTMATDAEVSASINALPNLAFGTGLTTTSSAGTDTISVTTNTYQAYDADWLGITTNGASLISAANYAAMRGLLDLEVGTDFNAYDANLITWPSAISATEVGYLDGLGGALTTLLSAKAPLASPVFTTSAALPQGAAPTVDAAGEIAIDTTSDQLIYFGGSKRVLTYKKFEPFVVKSPVDADDFLIGPFPTAITLTNILLVGQGTGSIVIVPQICGADTTTCSNLESITANGGVDTDDGSLAYSSVSAGGFVKILCSAPSGEVNFLSGSIYYVETGD